MQLTRHTDYALRLLMHLAQQDGARVQIADVANLHAISKTHLMKVANELSHLGFIETIRGRGGGIRLARPAAQINLADVIWGTEPCTQLIQCGVCGLLPAGCRLPGIFAKGTAALRAVLADYTLADVMGDPHAFLSAEERAAPAGGAILPT